MTLPKPYASGADWTLYHGDCRTILPLLDKGSVDAVVTDPPYGVDYEYGEAFDDSAENFERLVSDVWPRLRAIAHGPFLWFGSSSRMWRDLRLFPESPCRTIVWAPRFTLSQTARHGMRFKWHPCYCWSLSEESPIDRDVIDEPCEGRHWWDHSATKPLSLMETLVQFAALGSSILDPFTGSGTTGVACIRTGRRFIGIEIEERYCEIAARRISQAEPALFIEAAKERQLELTEAAT